MILVAALIVEVALLGRAMQRGGAGVVGPAQRPVTLIAAGSGLVVHGDDHLRPGGVPGRGRRAPRGDRLGLAGDDGLRRRSTGRFVLPEGRTGRARLTTVAAVAPPVFLVGLLGAVALLVSAVLLNVPALVGPRRATSAGPFAYYLEGVKGARVSLSWSVSARCVGVLPAWAEPDRRQPVLAQRDVRQPADPLLPRAPRGRGRWGQRWARPARDAAAATRGAARSAAPARLATPRAAATNPVTGFDPDDDIAPARPADRPRAGGARRRYWGPHLLINTTLNLVAGEELAWRDRKGESFVLSPSTAASKSTGYAQVTDDDAGDADARPRRRDLGGGRRPEHELLPVGAADGPADHLQRPAGLWMQNPRPRRAGSAGEPRSTATCCLTEFFGRTDGTGALRPPLRRRPLREPGRLRAGPPPLPLHRRRRRRRGRRRLRRQPGHPDPALPDRLRRPDPARHRAR